MTTKPIVNIEAVKLAIMVIDEFNELNLSEVELHENGKPLPIAPERMEHWRFIGLSNNSFVETRFWESPIE